MIVAETWRVETREWQGLYMEAASSLGHVERVHVAGGVTERQLLTGTSGRDLDRVEGRAELTEALRRRRWDEEPWFCSPGCRDEAAVRRRSAGLPASSGSHEDGLWIAKAWYWNGVLHRELGPARMLFRAVTADDRSSRKSGSGRAGGSGSGDSTSAGPSCCSTLTWLVTAEWWRHGQRHHDPATGPTVLTVPLAWWLGQDTDPPLRPQWHEEWRDNGHCGRSALAGPAKCAVAPTYVQYSYVAPHGEQPERGRSHRAPPFLACRSVTLQGRTWLLEEAPPRPDALAVHTAMHSGGSGTVRVTPCRSGSLSVLQPGCAFPPGVWQPSEEVYASNGTLRQQHYRVRYHASAECSSNGEEPQVAHLSVTYDCLETKETVSRRFHKLFRWWHEDTLGPGKLRLYAYTRQPRSGSFDVPFSGGSQPHDAATLQGLAFWCAPGNHLQALTVEDAGELQDKPGHPGLLRVKRGRYRSSSSHAVFLRLLREAAASGQLCPSAVLQHAMNNRYWSSDEGYGVAWLQDAELAGALAWSPAVVMTALRTLPPAVLSATLNHVPAAMWHAVTAFHADMPPLLRDALCLWISQALTSPSSSADGPRLPPRTVAKLVWFVAATPGHVPMLLQLMLRLAAGSVNRSRGGEGGENHTGILHASGLFWRHWLVQFMTAWRHVTWWLHHPSIFKHVPLRYALPLAGAYHCQELLETLPAHPRLASMSPATAAKLVERALLTCSLLRVANMLAWRCWRRFFLTRASQRYAVTALRVLSRWVQGALPQVRAVLHTTMQGYPRPALQPAADDVAILEACCGSPPAAPREPGVKPEYGSHQSTGAPGAREPVPLPKTQEQQLQRGSCCEEDGLPLAEMEAVHPSKRQRVVTAIELD